MKSPESPRKTPKELDPEYVTLDRLEFLLAQQRSRLSSIESNYGEDTPELKADKDESIEDIQDEILSLQKDIKNIQIVKILTQTRSINKIK